MNEHKSQDSNRGGKPGLPLIVPVIMIALSLIIALTVLAGRWSAERNNRIVSLAVDWNSIKDALGGNEKRLETALDMMRRNNLRTIALSEPTIGDLMEDGRVFLTTPGIVAGHSDPMGRLFLGTYDQALYRQMVSALRRKWSPSLITGREGRIYYAGLTGRLESVTPLGVGILSEESGYLLSRGFEIIPRFYNYPSMQADDLEADLAGLAGYKFNVVIFGGEEVMGYTKLVSQTASALQAKGLRFGQVEFSKQKGEETLARLMKGEVIRVHSIAPDEMKTMPPTQAVDRYVRAVQERNIRLCYLRFLPNQAGLDPLTSNMDYLLSIKRRLLSMGYDIGRPATLPVLGSGLVFPGSNAVIPWLLSLGILAALALLLRYLSIDLRFWQLAVLALLLLPIAVAAPMLFRKLGALGAAVVFPSLALAFLSERLKHYSPNTMQGYQNFSLQLSAFSLPSGAPAALRTALSTLWTASLITMIGALMGAGLMADRSFMLGIDRFAGIKLAHLLPLLVVVYLLLRDNMENISSSRRQIWRSLSDRPLLWGQAGLLGLVAVAGLFYLMRTGNDSSVAVSGLELKIRSVLEKLLVARPRTKEFLIGHPAALLALGTAFLPGLGNIRPWLLFIGAVGQISLFNSFCHIHTPLSFTLLRSFNGLWLGSLIGTVVLLTVAYAQTRRES